MARFITRVELHHAASGEDYKKLHQAMANAGFSMTITASDGTVYKLPTAEYYLMGNYTLTAVRDMANIAANKVSSSYMLIVSETSGSMWYYLPQVK